MGLFNRDKDKWPAKAIDADDDRWGNGPRVSEHEDRWGNKSDSDDSDSRWGDKPAKAGRFARSAAKTASNTGRFLWNSGPEWR